MTDTVDIILRIKISIGDHYSSEEHILDVLAAVQKILPECGVELLWSGDIHSKAREFATTKNGLSENETTNAEPINSSPDLGKP